ncbi:MAG: L-seryl-tRNA(Sec) selenium transferase [Candidatus Brocadia sp. WS118]|nr:MAG: L-seryl-tRNA(Sec) selenium transferase [Candidatus Brocadia sp. WS118]
MDKHQDILRSIPSVNELLESPEISKFTGRYPRLLVVETIRAVLEDIRQSLTDKKECAEAQAIDLSPQRLSHLIQQSLQQKFSGIGHAINATGIILHTGLGRAPLADEAAQQIQDVLRGFSTLEIEKQSGRRGIRYHHVEQLICMITGAESALVVNNNAAAVLLALDTLARGKEAIISRSQLVEIGGSFRMPDVMAKSGALLVEVGTTNKTYLVDYGNAITERTGLILKVHQSNFKIVGFTETVDLKDLVSLGKERNIPVMYDLGSGALITLEKFGLPYEPTVQESIKAGVDIVTFSTDKLLGGPQGGIIVGKRKWVDLLKRNPLTRAFRVGKLTIAALEATLKLYLEEDLAVKKVPVLKMMLTPLEVIEERCKRLISNVTPETKACMDIAIIDGVSEMGGGSLPGEGIPTKLISLHSEKMNAGEIAARLRDNAPPIFARIEQDHVLLDMRTVYDDEVDMIALALEKISLQRNVNKEN